MAAAALVDLVAVVDGGGELHDLGLAAHGLEAQVAGSRDQLDLFGTRREPAERRIGGYPRLQRVPPSPSSS